MNGWRRHERRPALATASRRDGAVVSRRRPASSHRSRQWPPGVTGG